MPPLNPVSVKDASDAHSSMDLSGRLSPGAAAPAPATHGQNPRAPGDPLSGEAKPAAPVVDEDGSFNVRTEEERSSANERLYAELEREKKRMGIAQVLEKVDGARAMIPGRPAPVTVEAAAVKALALRSSDALFTAWAAAGLAGKPPAVAFPRKMAIFLAGPSGCGIVEVQQRAKLTAVLYRDSGFADPASRVKALPASSKPVVVKRLD